jgi:hypothetical protein
MSRHPWSVRLLRAVLALWFALAGGELGLVHGCPMHDTAGGHGPVHGMAMRHHAPSHVGHPPASQDGTTPTPSHACTCVGACSATGALVAPVPAPAVAVARYAFSARAAWPGVPAVAAPRGAHVLPFGNGPPPVRATA